MGSLPEGWESDYDGTRWFYTYKPTGHVQYHFPSEGDEFPDFVDAFAPALVLAPEERLESRRQTTATGGEKGSTSGKNADSAEKKPRMSASARPVDGAWDGVDDDDDDKIGMSTFQPESFMYLGPGTYMDVSPLVEEEDEAAKRVVVGQSATVPGAEESKTISPVASVATTPKAALSKPDVAAPQSDSADAGEPIVQPIDAQPKHEEATEPIPKAEEPAEPSPAEAKAEAAAINNDTTPAMIDGREMPHELPAPMASRFDPVGIVAEMATEDTARAYIEIHPDPVEMGDNRILAPIETAAPLGIAELPEKSSPVAEKHSEAEAAKPGQETQPQQSLASDELPKKEDDKREEQGGEKTSTETVMKTEPTASKPVEHISEPASSNQSDLSPAPLSITKIASPPASSTFMLRKPIGQQQPSASRPDIDLHDSVPEHEDAQQTLSHVPSVLKPVRHAVRKNTDDPTAGHASPEAGGDSKGERRQQQQQQQQQSGVSKYPSVLQPARGRAMSQAAPLAPGTGQEQRPQGSHVQQADLRYAQPNAPMGVPPHQTSGQHPSHGQPGQQYPMYRNGPQQHHQSYPQSQVNRPAQQHQPSQNQILRPDMNRSATEPVQHGGQAYGNSSGQPQPAHLLRPATVMPPLNHKPRLLPAQMPASWQPVPTGFASAPSQQQHRAQGGLSQGAPSTAQPHPNPPYPLSDLPPQFSAAPVLRPSGRRSSDQAHVSTQSRPPLLGGEPRYSSGNVSQMSVSPPSSVSQSPGQPLHTPSPVLQAPGAPAYVDNAAAAARQPITRSTSVSGPSPGPPLPGKVPLASVQQQYAPNPGNSLPPATLRGSPSVQMAPVGQPGNVSKRHSLPAQYANGPAPPPIGFGQNGGANARLPTFSEHNSGTESQAQSQPSTPEQPLRRINERDEAMLPREASPLSTQSRTRPVSAVSSIQPPTQTHNSSTDYTSHHPPPQAAAFTTANSQYAPPQGQSPQQSPVSPQGQPGSVSHLTGHEWMATQGLTPMTQLEPQQKQSSWSSYLSSSKIPGFKPSKTSAQTTMNSLAEKSKDKLTKLRKNAKPGNPQPVAAVGGHQQPPPTLVPQPGGQPQAPMQPNHWAGTGPQQQGPGQGQQYYQQQQQQPPPPHQYPPGNTIPPGVPPALMQHHQQHQQRPLGQPYVGAYPSQPMPGAIQEHDRAMTHQNNHPSSAKIRRKPPPGQGGQAQSGGQVMQPQPGPPAGGPLNSHPMATAPNPNPGFGNAVNPHWVKS